MSRAALGLASIASTMGAAGVALAAVAQHRDGGDLARTAALFLIIHAAALVGVSAHVERAPRSLVFAGYALALGALLFCGDLATLAFSGARLFPYAAPIGGSLMIFSWVALAVVFAAGVWGARR